MAVWDRQRSFNDISQSLLSSRIVKTVYFVYDMSTEDYLILSKLLQAEFSVHPDAQQVKFIEKPWENALNLQFRWNDDLDRTTYRAIETRIRDLAEQYDAVLDVQDYKGI